MEYPPGLKQATSRALISQIPAILWSWMELCTKFWLLSRQKIVIMRNQIVIFERLQSITNSAREKYCFIAQICIWITFRAETNITLMNNLLVAFKWYLFVYINMVRYHWCYFTLFVRCLDLNRRAFFKKKHICHIIALFDHDSTLLFGRFTWMLIQKKYINGHESRKAKVSVFEVASDNKQSVGSQKGTHFRRLNWSPEAKVNSIDDNWRYISGSPRAGRWEPGNEVDISVDFSSVYRLVDDCAEL